jgi:hypothetical protein
MINPLEVATRVKVLADAITAFSSVRSAAFRFEPGPTDASLPPLAAPTAWGLFFSPALNRADDELRNRNRVGMATIGVQVVGVRRRAPATPEAVDIATASIVFNSLLGHFWVTPLTGSMEGNLPNAVEYSDPIGFEELESTEWIKFSAVLIYRIPFARPTALATT